MLTATSVPPRTKPMLGLDRKSNVGRRAVRKSLSSKVFLVGDLSLRKSGFVDLRRLLGGALE
jgi:hypothetical protein